MPTSEAEIIQADVYEITSGLLVLCLSKWRGRVEVNLDGRGIKSYKLDAAPLPPKGFADYAKKITA